MITRSRGRLAAAPAAARRRGWYGMFGKRLFDISFSLLVLTLFAPVYLCIALGIALTSPGPVFFIQNRVGRDGRLFRCIKFRTMVVNADLMLEELLSSNPACRAEFESNFKLKTDPRITFIGRWLRVTSLDEFPQFWNVLVGDMSVVGPRPLVQPELPKYGAAVTHVLRVRPGITGMWQVSGRNDIPYALRVKIDTNYARNHTFAMDLGIILRTIGVVLFPRGAY